ncbi:MAG: glycosyltransferase family 39 protein [Planctomycetes bacterium]|nr:glycosyltransferase family 39 protein [Planctomycetota bacterium]
MSPRAFDLDRRALRHACAIAFGVLALAVRFVGIGSQPLWFDEAMTLHIAHQPGGLGLAHNTPPLYYLLLDAWTRGFGVDATGLRSFSAVCGAAFVWASFHAARAMFGSRAAIAAATFALVAPLHLYYSQEARAYSLLLALLMVAQWAAWLVRERVRVGAVAALCGVSIAALYTHFLAAIPLACIFATAAWSAWRAGRRDCLRSIAAAGAVAVASLLPWLWWWKRHTPFQASDMQWLAMLWRESSGIGLLSASAELLVLGGQHGSPLFLKQFSAMAFPPALRVAGLVAFVVLLGVAVARLRASDSPMRRAFAQCVLSSVAPLAVLFAASFVHPTYAPGRYDLVAFPALTLLVGGSCAVVFASSQRWAHVVWIGAASVFAVSAVAKDRDYLAAPAAVDPFDRVAAHLTEHVQAEDLVVLCGNTGVPVLAHLAQRGFQWHERRCRTANGRGFVCRLLPPTLEEAPATASRYLQALEQGSMPASLAAMVQDAAAPSIWLVFGEELRTGGRDPAMDSVGRQLVAVLHHGGFTEDLGEPALGLVHFRRH